MAFLVAAGAVGSPTAAEDGPDRGRPATTVPADETPLASAGSGDRASGLDALATGGGRVPPEVVQAAIQLTDDPQAESRVAAFLASRNAFPRQMAGRALAIIRAARAQGALQSRAEVNQMADRVRGVARRAFNAPRVFNVTVASDFVPPPGTIALDFGPSHGADASGFEPVQGRGDHLRGRELRFKRSSATANALMADGVAGVERLQAVVPNGTYHVILLTRQPPGQAGLPPAPFGREIDAKQAVFPLGTAEPDTWYDRFFLANPVLSEPERQAEYQDLRRRLQRQSSSATRAGRGAGISFKVEVTTGFITVDLNQHVDTEAQIYLTGALIEPAGRATVWTRPQAGDTLGRAGPGARSDHPLDPGTSQPLPREIINLDQEIDRVLAAEGLGDAGPAGDGGAADGASGPATAGTFDEPVFQVRGNETFSPDGN